MSPSFWAWRARKLKKLRTCADHVLCIFPFEPALLALQGIGATYVGHPLASMIPMEPQPTCSPGRVGVWAGRNGGRHYFPGSRESEIKYLAHRFLAAARLIQHARPAIRFIVPAVPALRAAIEVAARDAGLVDQLHIVDGQSHTVLAACDVTLIASGTATLEAALFKRPMVIAYNMNRLSWHIMQRKKLQPWVGLPNILCGDFVVPELLQDALRPRRPWRMRSWPGSTRRQRPRPCSSGLRCCTMNFSGIPRDSRPMPLKTFLRAEQAPLVWQGHRPDCRSGRGRTRAAGRPGGGSRRDSG